jgi:hypothetical protein
VQRLRRCTWQFERGSGARAKPQGAGRRRVGLVSASSVLGGMDCAAVWLLRAVHWVVGKWQLWGCQGRTLGGVGWDEVQAMC